MADRRAVHRGDSLKSTRRFNNSSHDPPLDPALASATSISLLGSRAMLSFGGNSFHRSFNQEDNVDDYLDEYFNQPEKKRRLSVDQIQFLERNFAAENKLEPERKIQIAKELGLQPRQIAVWFQNRRARWKSRQLETDYETLHASYKSLKANYDSLTAENENLKAEVLRLKHNRPSGDIENLQTFDPEEPPQTMLNDSHTDVAFKNEEKSDELATDGVHRTINSPCALEFEESDISQSGEDELNANLLQPHNFPRIEDFHCHTPASSFYYGFPVDDHAFSFWSC